MKHQQVRRGAAAAFALLVLAACGGGGGGSASTTPAVACSTGTGSTLTLVSPANGQTGVSTNTTTIQVSANGVIPASIDIVLLDKNGASQTGSPLVGSQGSFSDQGFVLVSGDTYTVEYANSSQANCTPTSLGATFST